MDPSKKSQSNSFSSTLLTKTTPTTNNNNNNNKVSSLFSFVDKHSTLTSWGVGFVKTALFKNCDTDILDIRNDIATLTKSNNLTKTIHNVVQRIGLALFDRENGPLKGKIFDIAKDSETQIYSIVELNLLHIFRNLLQSKKEKNHELTIPESGELAFLIDTVLESIPKDELSQLKENSKKILAIQKEMETAQKQKSDLLMEIEKLNKGLTDIQNKLKKEKKKEVTKVLKSKETEIKDKLTVAKEIEKATEQVLAVYEMELKPHQEPLKEIIDQFLKTTLGKEKKLLIPITGVSAFIDVNAKILKPLEEGLCQLLTDQIRLLFPTDLEEKKTEYKKKVAKILTVKNENGEEAPSLLAQDLVAQIITDLEKSLPEIVNKNADSAADALRDILTLPGQPVDIEWNKWLSSQLQELAKYKGTERETLLKGIIDRVELVIFAGLTKNLEKFEESENPSGAFLNHVLKQLNGVLQKKVSPEAAEALRQLQILRKEERQLSQEVDELIKELFTKSMNGTDQNQELQKKIDNKKKALQDKSNEISALLKPNMAKLQIQSMKTTIADLEQKPDKALKAKKNEEATRVTHDIQKKKTDLEKKQLEKKQKEFDASIPVLYKEFYQDGPKLLETLEIRKENMPLPAVVLDPIWVFIEERATQVLIQTYADVTALPRGVEDLKKEYEGKFPSPELGKQGREALEAFSKENIRRLKEILGIGKEQQGKPMPRAIQLVAHEINELLPRKSRFSDEALSKILAEMLNDPNVHPQVALSLEWMELHVEAMFFKIAIHLLEKTQDPFRMLKKEQVLTAILYEFSNRVGTVLSQERYQEKSGQIAELQKALNALEDTNLSEEEKEKNQKIVDTLGPEIFPLITQSLHALLPKEKQTGQWIGLTKDDLPFPKLFRADEFIFNQIFTEVLPTVIIQNFGEWLQHVTERGKVFAQFDKSLQDAKNDLRKVMGTETGNDFAMYASRYAIHVFSGMLDHHVYKKTTIFDEIKYRVDRYDSFSSGKNWNQHLDGFAEEFKWIPGNFSFMYTDVLKQIEDLKKEGARKDPADLPTLFEEFRTRVGKKTEETKEVFKLLKEAVAAEEGFFESCVHEYRLAKGNEEFKRLENKYAEQAPRKERIQKFYGQQKERLDGIKEIQLSKGQTKEELYSQMKQAREAMDSVLLALPDDYEDSTLIAKQEKGKFVEKYEAAWQSLTSELQALKQEEWIRLANQQITNAKKELTDVVNQVEEKSINGCGVNPSYLKAVLGQQQVLGTLQVVNIFKPSEKVGAISMEQARREFLSTVTETMMATSMKTLFAELFDIQNETGDQLPMRITTDAVKEMTNQVNGYTDAKQQNRVEEWVKEQQAPVTKEDAKKYMTKLLKILNIDSADDLKKLVKSNVNGEQVWGLIHGDLAPQILDTFLDLAADPDLLESLYVSGLQTFNSEAEPMSTGHVCNRHDNDPLRSDLDKACGEMAAAIAKNLKLPLNLQKQMEKQKMEAMAGQVIGNSIHGVLGQKDFLQMALNKVLGSTTGIIQDQLKPENNIPSTAVEAFAKRQQGHQRRIGERKTEFRKAGKVAIRAYWANLQEKMDKKIEAAFNKFGAGVVKAVLALFKFMVIKPIYFLVVKPIAYIIERFYYNKKMDVVEDQVYDVLSHAVNKKMMLTAILATADRLEEERVEMRKKKLNKTQ